MPKRINAGNEIRHDGTSADPMVIAFDSGGTTGWAVCAVRPASLTNNRVMIMDSISHLAWGQFYGSERRQVDQMLELCDAWPGAARLTEQFRLRKFSADPVLLAPVRVNAAFSYASGEDTALYYQSPALAMTTITDDTLRDLGYWEKTHAQPHARDALRHAFTFWKRVKTQGDLLRTVFPAVLKKR